MLFWLQARGRLAPKERPGVGSPRRSGGNCGIDRIYVRHREIFDRPRCVAGYAFYIARLEGHGADAYFLIDAVDVVCTGGMVCFKLGAIVGWIEIYKSDVAASGRAERARHSAQRDVFGTGEQGVVVDRFFTCQQFRSAFANVVSINCADFTGTRGCLEFVPVESTFRSEKKFCMK